MLALSSIPHPAIRLLDGHFLDNDHVMIYRRFQLAVDGTAIGASSYSHASFS